MNAALPAIALEGLIELMAGTGFSAVVLNTQLLTDGPGSVIALLTEAVWIMVPVAIGVPVNVTVGLAPLASVPRLQVTKLVPVHVPVLGVPEARPIVAVPDWMYVTIVARAEAGPLLVTLTSWVKGLPTSKGGDVGVEETRARERSAERATEL